MFFSRFELEDVVRGGFCAVRQPARPKEKRAAKSERRKEAMSGDFTIESCAVPSRAASQRKRTAPFVRRRASAYMEFCETCFGVAIILLIQGPEARAALPFSSLGLELRRF